MKYELKLSHALLGTLVLLVVIFIITLKVGGASSWDGKVLLEKDGYCKIVYGERFNLNEKTLECEFGEERYSFTDSEFKEVCLEHKFFSKGFYSECWKNGERLK